MRRPPFGPEWTGARLGVCKACGNYRLVFRERCMDCTPEEAHGPS